MWFNWFVTPSVLFVGGLLVAVPIILHLVMRRKPKHFVFPAMRFVKLRKETNRRKLQLRHLLLLLLRCLAIALVAAALARPSVPSALLGNSVIVILLAVLFGFVALLATITYYQKKSIWLSGGLGATALGLLITLLVMLVMTLNQGAKFNIGNDETPVAAVLLLDTSPRMQYQEREKSRLDKSKEFAGWLLDELPRDSEVAVLDSRASSTTFSELTTQADVQGLQTTNTPQPLSAGLQDAIRLAAESEKAHKEIYVFTDMTERAWDADDAKTCQRLLRQAGDIQVYVIDVGAETPKNVSLGQLRLSAQSLSNNSKLQVETELNQLNAPGKYTVKLYLEKPGFPSILNNKIKSPAAETRADATFDLSKKKSEPVNFKLELDHEEKGTHHGYVSISGRDGLAVDDKRYFSFTVQEPWPILVATGGGVQADVLVNAIAPDKYDAEFACDVIQQNDLAARRLQGYSAICLLDPGPMTPAIWEHLAKYVESGGSLAIFLGRNAHDVNSFNHAEAQKLLPGKLSKVFRSSGHNLYIAPRHYDHPVMTTFRQLQTSTPWQNFPIYRYWVFKDPKPNSTVVLRYGNNRPALIEEAYGKGRVMTMTTPITDDSLQRDPQTWNELPTGKEAWPYFVLVNDTLKYIVAGVDTELNYLAGQTAVLPSHPNKDPARYALFTSTQQLDTQTAVDGFVTMQNTESLGTYRLKGQRASDNQIVVRGFSVNLPAEASDLTRIGTPRLDKLLGKDGYQYVKDRNQLHRQQRKARRGFEFFPYLLLLLGLILGLEHLLSNRFYRKDE